MKKKAPKSKRKLIIYKPGYQRELADFFAAKGMPLPKYEDERVDRKVILDMIQESIKKHKKAAADYKNSEFHKMARDYIARHKAGKTNLND